MVEDKQEFKEDGSLFFGKQLAAGHSGSGTLRGSLLLDNAASVRLLSLSPLLALSVDTITALCLTIMQAALVLPLLFVRCLILPLPSLWLRIPLLLFVMGCLVASLELVVQAWSVPFADHMGIYLPLLACSSLMLASVEIRAAKQDIVRSSAETLVTLASWSLIALILGTGRELFGTGSLFSTSMLLASVDGTIAGFEGISGPLQLFPFAPLRLLVTPAGGLLIFGLLLAGLQCLRLRAQKH